MTLIEVMLSVAILAIGMVILLEAASQCIAAAKATRLYQDARQLLAKLELEEPLDKTEVEEGSESGRFDGDFRNFTWTREIEMEGEEEDRLFKVTTRIIWSERGTKSHEEIVTYVYAPEEEE